MMELSLFFFSKVFTFCSVWLIEITNIFLLKKKDLRINKMI
ncbi:hypothetical protein TorRG33x02_070770 [Trema orientale]|uniref:Uncharacterized protein n=1 Tax=Trema orientale TaxID=63057 RepID=A0A2P5FGV1_TREOI|nr:hypothetical protein TorRG33x02_070770 [Trema orientale]